MFWDMFKVVEYYMFQVNVFFPFDFCQTLYMSSEMGMRSMALPKKIMIFLVHFRSLN